MGQMMVGGPLFASADVSAAGLRSGLMRLAAREAWTADEESLLETIGEQLRSEKGLRTQVHQLSESDAATRIDALAHIADAPEALRVLSESVAFRTEWKKTEITPPVLDQKSRDRLTVWAESIRSDEGQFASLLEPDFLSKLRYWGPDLIMELGAIRAGSVGAGDSRVAPYAHRLQQALENYFGRSTRQDLFEILDRGGGDAQHIAAYFARMTDRSIRLDEMGPVEQNLEQRILKSFRVRSATPRKSRWALLRLVRDFIHLGGIVERDLRQGKNGETASGLPYATALQWVSLAALMRANWQTFVLNGERKTLCAASRDPDECVMAVMNHGSYADILAYNIIFGDMDPRYAAKAELKDMTILGSLMTYSQNLFVDRGANARALMKLVKDADELYRLHPQRTLLIFAEGERYPDPGPDTESNMAPFTIGASSVAQQLVKMGRKLTILPVASYGLRRLLPKESRAADLRPIPWLDDAPERIRKYVTKLRVVARNAADMHVTENQPVVFSFGEPIDVNAIPNITAKGRPGQDASHDLRRLMFQRVWASTPESAQLAGLQHFMNEEFPKLIGRE